MTTDVKHTCNFFPRKWNIRFQLELQQSSYTFLGTDTGYQICTITNKKTFLHAKKVNVISVHIGTK